jgi:hypothetical protein
VLVTLLADIGTGWNQLLDVMVLVAVVLAEAAGTASGEAKTMDPRAGAVGMLLAIAVVWVDASGSAVTLVPAVQHAVASPDSFRRDPLSGLATARSSILSEDPYVPLSLGQVPVVLDPFMLPRIGQRHPAAVERLVERIDAQEFDLVLLVVRLQPVDQEWWREYHFGPDIVQAIARSYVYAGRVEGYYVYTPSDTGGVG